jgi:RNA polymerase sigma-70 factor (ECF subfamily)
VDQGAPRGPEDEEDLASTSRLSSTRDLVEVACRGDETATSLLLERLGPRLVLWVAARLSPKLRALFDPEDVVQEVLLAVHGGLRGLEDRGERAFFSWVFRIAENRIRDFADYQGAAKRRVRPPPPVTQTTPSTAAMRSEALLRVRAAIERLPEDYRIVLQLRRLEERDTPEVAERMQRSENAVRVLYCRALKALRDAIGVSDSSL